MTAQERKPPGTVAWLDLTVPDADTIRDFYAAVVGWQVEPLEMGGYSDYFMKSPATEEPAAGICHARGVNAALPPSWLAYIVVADLDASVRICIERGGSVVAGPTGDPAEGRYCVIRDPAGAVAALIDQP